jgi:UDP-glucuronate 4-epimerase
MQLGDVEKTYADIESAKEKLGYSPKTDVQEGIDKFIDWFVKSSFK